MSAFELILRFPRGSVLIGGHATIPGGVHAVHARLDDGRPFLPASAIRGALREALEGLLRATGERACAGGDGAEPKEGAARQVCALDGGRPCRACRLFGGGRDVLPDGERTFSALVLGEARVAEQGLVEWQSRFGVAINRQQHRAADHMLVRRLVPEPGLTFRATGRLTTTSDTLQDDLLAAIRATTHLGSGRSSGLARVEMELRWIEPATQIDPLPVSDRVEFGFELTAPASLGVPLAPAMGNFRETRREIPGSALRGAIGFALAEVLSSPNDNADFQALVDEKSGAIFDFSYAVDLHAAAAGPAGPWPLTALACKRDKAHGMVDTLLDRIVVANLQSAADVRALEAAYRCPMCQGPLGGTESSRRAARPPPTQVVTRVTMDRERGAARDEHLFSYAQIKAGAHFLGQIRRIPERSRALLARALAGPLSVGRARSLGWGSIKVVPIAKPAPMRSIEDRARAFDEALAARLSAARLDASRVGRLVPITLLSPLVLGDDGDDGRRTLEKALDLPVHPWPVVARRFELERGWDQRKGARPVVQVARAGGVFVIELPEGRRRRDLLPALARLEAEGAGERTTMGFGRVICFDPVNGEGARRP